MTLKNGFIAKFFVLLLLSLSFAANADTASIGKIIFVEGQLTAVSQDKPAKPLRRGSDIFQGETLATAANSQCQIRFSDGGLFVLQANTQINVEQYQNGENGKKFNAKFIKGALRSVSGAIAKNEPQNYQVNTPVATIGVRGTNFSAALNASGALSAGVWQGNIVLSNAAGEIIIGESSPFKFANVTSATAMPVGSLSMPPILLNNVNAKGAALPVEAAVIPTDSNAPASSSNPASDREICVQ